MGKWDVYLEMTYRRGKAVIGYLYLPRRKGDHAARSQERPPGLVVDFAEDGRPIGIEIISPSAVTPEMINSLLRELHVQPVDQEELAPLSMAV